jgi:hypothetical protein
MMVASLCQHASAFYFHFILQQFDNKFYFPLNSQPIHFILLAEKEYLQKNNNMGLMP